MFNSNVPVTVGLDVHARSIRLCAVRADELLDERTVPNDPARVASILGRWPDARAVYEAGPTGYGLHRHLTGAGINCSVIAPALVPVRPGDRVKTDSRDARKLAFLHASGLLRVIWVPPPEWEAARDLIRAREAARIDRMRDRHRLGKFLLRQGRVMPGRSWGKTRRSWIAGQRFDFPAQQVTLDTYLHALDLVDARIVELDRMVDETAICGPWQETVGKLRCFRGIDTLTALAVTVEIGDFHRFESAESFMAYVGLVPCEHSSGEKRRQGSITKVGNVHIRRLLIEAAWHARHRPKVSYELARRQEGCDPVTIERAWRAQQRLYRQGKKMAARGKPSRKIVVAQARELAGFIWATATGRPLT